MKTTCRRPSRFRAPDVILYLALAHSFAWSAAAHEYWLAPSRYDVPPGTAITISAMTGEGFQGEPKAWSPTHGLRLVVRASRALDLRGVAEPGEFAWARFAPTDRGGALFGFVSDFTPITL